MAFNSLMSREEVLKALLQLLPDQFKQPPKLAAEFGEGYVAPEEDAERLIAGRFVGRVFTNEDFDVGFSLDQETAVHRLQGCGDGCARRTARGSPRTSDRG
jgi:hypothetical protein